MRNKVQTLEHLHNFSANLEKRELFLHSSVEESEDDPGLDYRSALKFIKNIRLLEGINHNPILIHLLSIGGSVDDGMAIYDAIAQTRSKITILVHGYAASMGVIILQAADYRVLMPNAFLMVHGTSISTSDTVTAIESLIDFHKFQSKTMLDILCDKCIGSPMFKANKLNNKTMKEYILNIIREKVDWYLTAENAIHHGLADAIIGSKLFIDQINV